MPSSFSFVSYTGNGTTQTFNVPFQYISQAHVEVYLDGTLRTTGISWDNATTIRLNPAPNAGAIVRLSRNTPKTVALVDFQDAGILTESALDLNTRQGLLIVQEAFDEASNVISAAVAAAVAASQVAGRSVPTVAPSDIGRLLVGRAADSYGWTNNLTFNESTGVLTALGFSGPLTGNVTGNVAGNLTGNVTGNVAGNVAGNLTGNVAGDLTGNVTGNLTGNVAGNLTGNVTSVTPASTGTGVPNLSQVQGGAFLWGGTAGGTANALTISLNPPITAYAAGQEFRFISGAAANTGAVTLNINGLGAVAVNKGDGTLALTAGNLPASVSVTVEYDGTRFRLKSPATKDGLAPLPTASAGAGEIVSLFANNTNLTLPAGGTWFYLAYRFANPGNTNSDHITGVANGGTILSVASTAYYWRGTCWRIA